MRSILGLGAAIALAGLHVASPAIVDTRPDRSRRGPPDYRDPAPNDFGPVIDTTPESKRARRRRLAKAKS